MNTNDNNNQDRSRVVNELKKIRKEQLKKIEELTERKTVLLRGLTKDKLNKLTPQQPNDDRISILPRLQGFVLSNFSIQEVNDGEKKTTYSAFCEDAIYPFKISVTMSEDQIDAVHANLAEHSALLEIQKILDCISEERCPHLLLMTIEQFIHLSNSRLKVVQKLTSRSHSNKFQVYLPNFQKRNAPPMCTIIARRPRSNDSLEIQWTMEWNKIYQTLVHQFNVPSNKNRNPWQKKMDSLRAQIFTNKNEGYLMDWWDELCNDFNSV